MQFRGFDKNFWIGLAIGIPTLIVLILLSHLVADWVGINRIFIFMVLAGVVWLALHLLEMRLRKLAGPEVEPIFCEWDAKLDSVTFSADEEMTHLSLQSHGVDIRSAVGKRFVCMTECSVDGKDYYFDGEFGLSEDGKVIVRVTNPKQLPACG